jgi:hypothetical protein
LSKTLEVPVVGRALLLAIGLADRAVHVEDQLLQRLSPMHLVDPLTAELHQCSQVASFAERFGLEASHLSA